jgi:flagellar motor switch protein FliN/FliY
MALISRIPVAEVAAVTARALEELLGHDVVLTTGVPELGDPADEILPEGPTRAIVLPFSDGIVGEVTLVVGASFATAMEAATPDASLTTAAVPALERGADAIALTIHIGVSAMGAGEIATETLLTSVVGDFAAVPILENDTCVACLVVRIVDDEPVQLATPIPAAAPTIPAAAPTIPAPPLELSATPATYAPAPVSVPAASLEATPEPQVGIALHEFQSLSDGAAGSGQLRPLTLLNDVNMEVTAELGRRRMKVRDIVGLQPGSVVELDRAAGSPVDVLVNGALVWHGEVVIVDEEFGIRVSEIVLDEN